jgi:3-oxoacyl-[acyl-carrier protein] reductase
LAVDLSLAGKVALVAGSSRGIGLAIARAFVAEGARTVVTGRDPSSLADASSALGAEFDQQLVLPYRGDLCREADIDSLIEAVLRRWGRIDCLVANVGSGRGSAGWSIEDHEWTELLEQNLLGAVRLVARALPTMIGRGSGSIVLIASITGIEGTSAPLSYGAAKAALINYGKNLARLVAASNIRVNCVAPGNILFSGGTWERHLRERPEEVQGLIRAEVPLRRFGTPDEIADLVVFLASERAAFITGSCVVADGGQSRSV